MSIEVGPSDQRPNLPDFLSTLALTELSKKKLFGGYEIGLVPFATQALLLFHEGISLGYTRHERLTTIAKMCIRSQAFGVALQMLGLAPRFASEDEAVLAMLQYLGKSGPDGLRHYATVRGGAISQPQSLLDLFVTSFAPADLDLRSIERIRAMRKRRIPLTGAVLQGGLSVLGGISVGATTPELGRLLCRSVWGDHNSAWWSELEAAGGLGPPEQSDPQLLEEVVLAIVTEFAQRKFPELVEHLQSEALD